ncbi:MAG: hypothetical protein AAF684_00510 [Pseudomonadota bacterium]
MKSVGAALGAAAACAAASAHAEDLRFDFAGFVQTEARAFFEPPQFTRQTSQRLGLSVAVQPELRVDAGDFRFTLVPFARWDSIEKGAYGGRTRADLREANIFYQSADWDLTVGLAKVFWGRAESENIVDIVNQTDFAEDSDGDEKLGQPMVQFNYLTDIGQVGLFVMPGFRDRTFVDGRNRNGFALPVDADDPDFEAGAGRWHPDLAFAYSHFIDEFDFRVSHFYGHSREPRLVQTPGADGPKLVPAYDLIHQTGVDGQATLGPALWKLEAIHRRGQGDPFFATVAGVEYTLFSFADGRGDLGLIAEHLYDGRDDDAPTTIFDNDLFLGARYAFNDVSDTEILGGGVVDLENGATALSLEFETRLFDNWSIEADARGFVAIPDDDPLSASERDSVLQIRLNRFF